MHTYILFCSNKTIRTHLGKLDSKVHRTLTTAHENMKKIQNKRMLSQLCFVKLMKQSLGEWWWGFSDAERRRLLT